MKILKEKFIKKIRVQKIQLVHISKLQQWVESLLPVTRPGFVCSFLFLFLIQWKINLQSGVTPSSIKHDNQHNLNKLYIRYEFYFTTISGYEEDSFIVRKFKLNMAEAPLKVKKPIWDSWRFPYSLPYCSQTLREGLGRWSPHPLSTQVSTTGA